MLIRVCGASCIRKDGLRTTLRTLSWELFLDEWVGRRGESFGEGTPVALRDFGQPFSAA